jgi:hypothetical protein
MAHDAKTHATAAGLPWDQIVQYLLSLNWIEFYAFIRQLLDIFRGKKQPQFSHQPGTGCGPEQVDCAKEHFKTIQAVAACGEQCCTGGST